MQNVQDVSMENVQEQRGGMADMKVYVLPTGCTAHAAAAPLLTAAAGCSSVQPAPHGVISVWEGQGATLLRTETPPITVSSGCVHVETNSKIGNALGCLRVARSAQTRAAIAVHS